MHLTELCLRRLDLPIREYDIRVPSSFIFVPINNPVVSPSSECAANIDTTATFVPPLDCLFVEHANIAQCVHYIIINPVAEVGQA